MVLILNFKGKRLSIYLHYFSHFFFLNWALNTWMIELLRILLDTCNNDLIKYISVYGTIAQHIYISALGPGNNSNQSANVYCQTWNPISNCGDAFNQKHLKGTNQKKNLQKYAWCQLDSKSIQISKLPSSAKTQNCLQISK